MLELNVQPSTTTSSFDTLCKILFDKDNFFHNVLSKLKDKLEKYKSVKVSYKGRYYWKLKPDYKWGDIINL